MIVLKCAKCAKTRAAVVISVESDARPSSVLKVDAAGAVPARAVSAQLSYVLLLQQMQYLLTWCNVPGGGVKRSSVPPCRCL